MVRIKIISLRRSVFVILDIIFQNFRRHSCNNTISWYIMCDNRIGSHENIVAYSYVSVCFATSTERYIVANRGRRKACHICWLGRLLLSNNGGFLW